MECLRRLERRLPLLLRPDDIYVVEGIDGDSDPDIELTCDCSICASSSGSDKKRVSLRDRLRKLRNTIILKAKDMKKNRSLRGEDAPGNVPTRGRLMRSLSKHFHYVMRARGLDPYDGSRVI